MKPENTTKSVKEDPRGFALESMAVGTPDAIERQERQGQDELCRSCVLPSEGMTGRNGNPGVLELIVGMGGEVGEAVEGDPTFINVTLPEGWSKEKTDHSMWSNLVDGNGFIRARMFYKAAFYDRSAFISAVKRFSVKCNDEWEDESRTKQGLLGDARGEVEFKTDAVPVAKDPFSVDDKVREEVESFLDKNFPEWRSPAAYWD